MKRTIIKLITGLLVLGMILIGLTKPSLWKNQLINLVHEKFPDYSLKIDEIKGHPLTSIKLLNVGLTHTERTVTVFEYIKLDLDLFSSIKNSGITLNRIDLNGLVLDFSGTDRGRTTKDVEQKHYTVLDRLPDLVVKDLEITDSRLSLDSVNDLNIRKFTGTIHSNRNILSFGLTGLEATWNTDTIRADSGKFDVMRGHARLSNFDVRFKNMNFLMDINVPYSKEFSASADLKISGIDSIIAGVRHPVKNLAFSIKIDKDTFFGNFTAGAAGFQGFDGKFMFSGHPGFYKVDNLEINHGNSSIQLEGLYEGMKRIAGRARIKNLDILPWMDFTRQTSIDGLIVFESELVGKRIDNTMLTVELMENKFTSGGMVAVSGTVVYKDSIISITDPLMVEIGSSLAITKGQVNLADNTIDLGFNLTRTDVEILNRFIDDPIESGVFSGQFSVKGDLATPDIELSLSGENVRYREFALESASVFANLSSVKDKPTGSLKIDLGKGTFRNYGFNQGSGDIQIDSNRIHFKNIYFNRENDYVQMDAVYSDKGSLHMSRIQMAYAGHYLVNSGPLSIYLDSDGRFSTRPFSIHINDGTMEGEVSFDDQFRGHLKLANVNAGIFHSFIQDEKYRIYGNIFGEIQTFSVDSTQNFTIEASIKNGKVSKWSFDDLIISLAYNNGILNIDELVMTKGKNIGFEMTGIIPLDTSQTSSERLNIQSSYRNVDLNMVSVFLIPDFFHLGGITSGKLNVSGTTKKTLLDFDLEAKDAEFDILDLGLIKARGNYDGQQLTISEISSLSKTNEISGSGYVPFNFNVGTEGFAKFNQNDPIYLDLKGKTGNFHFLTDYIEDVDSISGQFDVHLVLRGSMDHLVREGSISIKKANIYTTLLDDPVTNVNASGILRDNILTISSFTGFLSDPRKQKKSGKTTVSGNIDLTRFFQPKYDLKIAGKKAYFRTLTGDLEGTVNLGLTMTGRDTISIKGKIPIQDVKMYQEFTATTVAALQDPDAKILMDYKINFPIEGEFRLINSQVDVRMTGEISMSQFGNSDAVYTGELFIVSGKFYYYGDIFNVSDGYIALDERGFNPYLDIQANTTIEDEKIFINLVGNMNNPQLILSSASGFSQSDILELLTWRKRFEDQELSSTGFGSQATALVGVWFENQLERNLLKMTGLKEMGLVEDVSISGTSTLLDPQKDKDVSIKAELTEKVALNYAYKRSFSLGNPENSMLGVELKLNKYVSLVANVDKTGNLHVKYRLRYSY